ncbi:hypothetical protein, partial [Micromonospora sp. NPDC049799]|uniref:hypothetical protein n=1 Tax=Micromonospora sp. NPDC049799 TaxID=3154741 RepID=UPI0033C2A445
MAWTRGTTRSRGPASPRQRKVAGGVALAVTVAAAFAVATGTGEAAENCQGLDTALRNNLTFIADQRRDPDVNSSARIANREAVVDLIQQRRAAAGCAGTVDVAAAACPMVPWETAMAAELDRAWAVTEEMTSARSVGTEETQAQVKRLGGIFGGIRGIVQGAQQAQQSQQAGAEAGRAPAGPGADNPPAQGGGGRPSSYKRA